MKHANEHQLLLQQISNEPKAIPFYESTSDNNLHLLFQHRNLLLDSPHFHESFEFIFILKGSATLHIKNNSYYLSEGDFCFCDKFMIHYYDTYDKNNFDAICLVFGKDYCHHLFQQYSHAAFYPTMTDKRKNEKIFSLIQTWFHLEQPNYLTNCAYINLLLDTIISEYGLYISNQQTDQHIIEFVSYLNEHYHEDISLESISKAFGYSREYFCTIFKKLTGQSFSAFLNLIRIQKAMELMHRFGKSRSIESIANEVGYKNLVTFYRNYNKYRKKYEDDKV